MTPSPSQEAAGIDSEEACERFTREMQRRLHRQFFILLAVLAASLSVIYLFAGCSHCYACQHGSDHYRFVQTGHWLNIYDENGVWQGAARTK